MKKVMGQLKEQERIITGGGVVIAPNLKKEQIRIDGNGNEIHPKTKMLIKRATQ